MNAQSTRFDSAVCYIGVLVASAAVALPWALSYPFSGVVADYTHANFYGKPLPFLTDALLALRPYCLAGALMLALLLSVVGVRLVRSSRQPIRSSLFFVLAGVVLACFSFTFVSVSLVLPFVRIIQQSVAVSSLLSHAA